MGFRVAPAGRELLYFVFRVLCFEIRVSGVGFVFRDSDCGLWDSGFVFRVSGFGFRDSGCGIRV